VPKVKNKLREEIQNIAEQICRCMKFHMEVECSFQEEGMQVNFKGKDAEFLLQKNGEVLNAMEYILNRIFSEQLTKENKIVTDAQNFRKFRNEELNLIAQKASEKVMQYGSSVQLQAMPPHERRIIHMALKENARVKTVSAGEGEERAVIIEPA
jgi:spoIIIJ-associated protein